MEIREVDPVHEREELFESLRLRASWLSYPGFVLLSMRLLRSLGYQHVHPVGRKSFKGPNSEGGIDMRATVGTGIDQAQIVIQLKRYRADRNVACLAVDALRGVMCRDRATFGLLISTATFSDKAHQSVRACSDWPVSLISGTDLGALLADRRIGVIEQKHPVTGRVRLVFDEEYFDTLDRYARIHQKRLLSLT